MVHSGFKRFGQLSFIYQFSKRKHRMASKSSNCAKITPNISWFYQTFFSKHQNKDEFKNLDDFEVLSSDFLSPRTSAASLTSSASTTSLASTASKALFHQKNFLILMIGSSLAPKWPIWAPFCGMDHQKSNFSLICDTFSDGGCWDQPMLLFQKLFDETQMSKPPE